LPPTEGPEVAAHEDGEATPPPPGRYQPAKELKETIGRD
jgi:hypothetical protein